MLRVRISLEEAEEIKSTLIQAKSDLHQLGVGSTAERVHQAIEKIEAAEREALI